MKHHITLLSAAWLALASNALAQPNAAPPLPVIDVHMHAPAPNNYPDWRAAMDQLNVRRAIFIGTPSQLEQGRAQDSARFMPSLVFPCEGGVTASIGAACFENNAEFPTIAQLRTWVREGRVAAFGELMGQYMGIAPNDPRMEPYYALAEELDVPIGLHMGIGPPGAAYVGRPGFPPRKSPNYTGGAGDPLALEPVLIRHPRLRVYVMHAAWPNRDHMLYMLYMHPQLYVDVSVLQWAIPRAAYYSYLKDMVDAGFGERIMFGSDGGVRHLREGVTAILDAPFLTEPQKRAILHDNAARFFRLDAPAAAPAR